MSGLELYDELAAHYHEEDAGLVDVRLLDPSESGFYQPIITAHQPDG